MVFGGNNSQTNASQKAKAIKLFEADSSTTITLDASSVSGRFNHLILTNTTGYTIYVFCILTIGMNFIVSGS